LEAQFYQGKDAFSSIFANVTKQFIAFTGVRNVIHYSLVLDAAAIFVSIFSFGIESDVGKLSQVSRKKKCVHKTETNNTTNNTNIFILSLEDKMMMQRRPRRRVGSTRSLKGSQLFVFPPTKND